MKNLLLVSILFCLCLLACQKTPPSNNGKLAFSTDNDSTLFYYQKGWQQIMDEGNYGPSEVSYRKALEFDPDFLVGKSVLARLTTSLEERLQLFEELEAKKNTIKGDERLVLDVYIGLTEYTNIREQEPEKVQEARSKVLALAENNFRQIVHKYPEEIYLKSEYIEILHSLKGPKASLDSLQALLLDHQKDNPFLLGYAASMEAKQGNFEEALTKAKHLKTVINDPTVPKSHAVFADVYFQMGSLNLAKKYADRAVELDPRNLDASRLKARIDEELAELE